VSEQVGLYITFWAAPGKFDELLETVKTMLPVVAAEAGTLAYAFHKVTGTLEGVSVYEVYESAEAQRIHGESAAINALKARLPALLGAPPERHQLTPIPGAKGLPF
jgi:quinol monooxygenase YgiN